MGWILGLPRGWRVDWRWSFSAVRRCHYVQICHRSGARNGSSFRFATVEASHRFSRSIVRRDDEVGTIFRQAVREAWRIGLPHSGQVPLVLPVRE